MSTSSVFKPKKLDDHLRDIAHAHPDETTGGTLMRTMMRRRRQLWERFQTVTNPPKAAHAASENPKGAPSEKPAAPDAAAKEKPAEGAAKKGDGKKEEKPEEAKKH